LDEDNLVGRVTKFYVHPGVAVVKLTEQLAVGDSIAIKGATTSLEQTVESMQIEHVNIERAKAGQIIGLKVAERVRRNDKIYRR
jgi:putative protease